MKEELVQGLLTLVRASVMGEPIPEAQKQMYTPEFCQQVLSLAARHDLQHLVADAMLQSLNLEDPERRLRKIVYTALYRYQRLDFAAGQTTKLLEAARIPFLPLKGYVMRERYPQPWMRTSCDLDVLVPPDRLEEALTVLTAQGGFENKGRGYHDISLKAPNGSHVELHFSLLEDGRFPKAEKLVEQVWSHAVPVTAGGMAHQLSDEMYLFYHILHMANHIREGGCGVRPFLDLWLLRQTDNQERREKLLASGGLLTFARQAEALAEVWFSGATHSETTQRLEAYVLRGGVFGSLENQMAMNQAHTGGSAITARIFLSPEILRGHYPVLERHGWLMPVCQVARWFRLLSPRRFRRAVGMVKANANTTDDQYNAAANLLRQLELE